MSDDPHLIPLEGQVIAVTGGAGFVGCRIIALALERGVARAIACDRATPRTTPDDPRYLFLQVDICDADALLKAFRANKVTTVIHTAALVGPYHEPEQYLRVNYQGTVNVVEACKSVGARLVYMGSPSARMDGSDVRNLGVDDMPFPRNFIQEYARTKAMAEQFVVDQVRTQGLRACVVSPHQVYGPGDTLFLPSFIAKAREGRLRIVGTGENVISLCYMDNIAHASLIAAQKLYEGSPVLGQSYFITDGEPRRLWDVVDLAVTRCGLPSLRLKYRAPYAVTLFASYVVQGWGWLTRTRYLLHPMSVRMITIDRWFDISKAERDLGYRPHVPPDVGLENTLAWISTNYRA